MISKKAGLFDSKMINWILLLLLVAVMYGLYRLFKNSIWSAFKLLFKIF